MLLFDPTNPIKAKQIVLFLPPLNPEKEKWDGLRDELGNQLREEENVRAIDGMRQPHLSVAKLPRSRQAGARARQVLAGHYDSSQAVQGVVEAILAGSGQGFSTGELDSLHADLLKELGAQRSTREATWCRRPWANYIGFLKNI